jgi:hypothetical protein
VMSKIFILIHLNRHRCELKHTYGWFFFGKDIDSYSVGFISSSLGMSVNRTGNLMFPKFSSFSYSL